MRRGKRKSRKAERHDSILLELRLKPHVRISDLAAQFDVTTETIRRDVEELSKLGQLSRTHGVASAPQAGTTQDVSVRARSRIKEREQIGRFAASLLAGGETVMIDAGTTTLQFARALSAAEIAVTAITNSLHVAVALGRSPAAKVIVCPGDYLATEAATIGSECVDFLARYNVDHCFIGASALSEVGVSEAVDGFAAVKRMMLRQSGAVNLLADRTKFGLTHFASVCTLHGLDRLITDAAPEEGLSPALRGAGVAVLVAS
jgi:DeoR/GlpR family transcriptional regulator of sugar metabolism